MGRKAYIADVATACSEKIPGIISVAKGSEDGEVRLCYVPSTGVPIEISLISLEVGGYPSENMYMITTESMDLPDGVNDVLQGIQNVSTGVRIHDLLATISQKLERHLSAGSRENPVDIASDMEVDEEADNEGSESEDFPDSDDDDGWTQGHSGPKKVAHLQLSPEAAARINRRIRADLRAVKRAGFRPGILDGAKAESMSSMISMSVKVDKLGLSEEAIQAWDLEPQQYIIILARYTNGYKDFDDIISEASQNLSIEYRIGVGRKYKPTRTEAHAAFSESKKYDPNSSNKGGSQDLKEETAAGFGSIFISSSLNEFINKSLVPLVKIRNNVGLGWSGAKSWYNRKQSRMDNAESDLPDSLFQEDAIDKQNPVPEMISCDHFTDHGDEQISFPLLAAQFALRYLVRCTEYCLVCHDKLSNEFEALKPYVCDKPLCLYQYMSLGFGPSIEHEILTQPHVVDLLISFCYASAYSQRIREYPTGMALLVPPVLSQVTSNVVSRFGAHQQQNSTGISVDIKGLEKAVEVKFNPVSKETTFDSQVYDKSPVNVGEWLIIITPERQTEHYRVHEVAYFPTVQLSKHSFTLENSDENIAVPTPATTPPPQDFVAATMVPYSENFDDMLDASKAETIVALLNSLPSIREMRSYLLRQSRSSEPNLRAWNDRISPAALGILRWIVASNRSCIVQVDNCPGQEEMDVDMSKVRLEQRISHIASGYVQFRFAQGSPDKEQRFLNALKAQQANLNTAYPTIFAWHGSNLANWHSIIRSGLDFKDTLNGRAYGHGVYHARDQNTSIGYAAANQLFWPGSALKITSAMSLNEIVNCPAQFASNTPFLVVQHIDWIQCRYLLVQVAASGSENPTPHGINDSSATINEARAEDIPQDPASKATSTLAKTIGVPSCAITTSKSFRADKHKFFSLPIKNKKKVRKCSKADEDLSLTVVSDSDDQADIDFLQSDDEREGTKPPQTPLTDFVPGSLDQSTLPMLAEPSYATPMATKTLQRNLMEVLDIQKKTPLHELGWYIDPELVSNMYQWIVELHSFDPFTLLAKDMKLAGITSVVLEIRFGKDYPHSPPFVRVIRPRFLPFMAGGGGHVTAGGAMCMELLTNSGWSAVSSIESVLLQVRMAMMNPEPKPARLEDKSGSRIRQDYGVSEAIEAYKRACAQHGWQVPKDFSEFASTLPTVAGPSGLGKFYA